MKQEKIPYGVSNFKQLMQNNSLYIDKTRFIETLENQVDYAIFLRPRRFGKSLFVSTLWYYYDENYQDIWRDLFADLYIGQHPTALKSAYKILFLEFSGIVTESHDSTYQGFSNKIEDALRGFLERYHYSKGDIQRLSERDTPETQMNTFFEITKEDKIYLLIDEYDHFANSILGSDFNLFKDIVGKGGFVRSFYETIKTATQKGIVERLFITGVTPITLDSLTSGFNIGDNISNDNAFNEMAGFTLSETQVVLETLQQDCPELKHEANQNKLIQDITHFYNGYKFSIGAENSIYNASLLMYFVKKFDRKKCQYPIKMLDSNIASDYGKIMQLFTIGDKESNYAVLNELIYEGEVLATLKDNFNFGLSTEDGFDRDEFISLLLAMGFVTIKEQLLNKIKFVIPNYVIKHLYFNYFQIETEQRNQLKFNTQKIENALFELAINNEVSPFENELKKVIHLLSNRDLQNFHEKHLQTLLLTILNISDFYFIKSETEVNKKYPDIMLLQRSPFEVNYQYLFELKFCKKKDKDWEQKKQQGIEQIKGYLKLEDIKALSQQKEALLKGMLKSYLIISNGDDLEMVLVE